MIGFSSLDVIAFAVFVAAWLGYHYAVEMGPHAARSLNMKMNLRRARWVREAMARDNRIVDTQVMNGLQNGTAFFASTSLIAIGGALTLLQSTDRVVALFEDLPFGTVTTRAGWEMKVIGLAVIFGYAFFKFAWSYRLFNYCVILIGAMPPAKEHDPQDAARAIHEMAEMNIAAAGISTAVSAPSSSPSPIWAGSSGRRPSSPSPSPCWWPCIGGSSLPTPPASSVIQARHEHRSRGTRSRDAVADRRARPG